MWRILSSLARETTDTLSHLEKRSFYSQYFSRADYNVHECHRLLGSYILPYRGWWRWPTSVMLLLNFPHQQYQGAVLRVARTHCGWMLLPAPQHTGADQLTTWQFKGPQQNV
ncbi:hypothetical protein EMCRGX_G019548 [Ephydatia muelleri]